MWVCEYPNSRLSNRSPVMRRDALRTMLFRAALASGILLLLASGVAFAQGFSGYEAFAGVPNSAGTGKNDNLFAGWTDTTAIANGWQSPPLSTNGGGIAAGKVDYNGQPRFRQRVAILPPTPRTKGDGWW